MTLKAQRHIQEICDYQYHVIMGYALWKEPSRKPRLTGLFMDAFLSMRERKLLIINAKTEDRDIVLFIFSLCILCPAPLPSVHSLAKVYILNKYSLNFVNLLKDEGFNIEESSDQNSIFSEL